MWFSIRCTLVLLKPALSTSSISVFSFVQFSSAITSGKNVDSYSRPLYLNSIYTPCLPSCQSCWSARRTKLLNKETDTDKWGSSVLLIGSNLSSSVAAKSAYSARLSQRYYLSKVPIQPLNSLSEPIVHVTKSAYSAKTFSMSGKSGQTGFFYSWAIRASKQNSVSFWWS